MRIFSQADDHHVLRPLKSLLTTATDFTETLYDECRMRAQLAKFELVYCGNDAATNPILRLRLSGSRIVALAPDPADQGIIVGGVLVGTTAFVERMLEKLVTRCSALLDKAAGALGVASGPDVPSCHGIFNMVRLCDSSLATFL